jgi:hypothetical protein
MKPVEKLSDAELETLLRRAAALPDAPPALVRAAIGLFPATPPSVVAAAGAALRRLTAALRFDSWAAAPVPAGVRALPSDARHLLFSAMGRDIDLRITPAADSYALSGQILGPDEAGRIELAGHVDAGSPIEPRLATLDALGEFRLDAVPRGTYVLTVRVGNDEIVLPPIEVGERSD